MYGRWHLCTYGKWSVICCNFLWKSSCVFITTLISKESANQNTNSLHYTSLVNWFKQSIPSFALHGNQIPEVNRIPRVPRLGKRISLSWELWEYKDIRGQGTISHRTWGLSNYETQEKLCGRQNYIEHKNVRH